MRRSKVKQSQFGWMAWLGLSPEGKLKLRAHNRNRYNRSSGGLELAEMGEKVRQKHLHNNEEISIHFVATWIFGVPTSDYRSTLSPGKVLNGTPKDRIRTLIRG